MTIQAQYSAKTIKNAVENVIETFFKIKKEEIELKARRSLGQQAQEIKDAIVSDIIAIHPLRKIIEFALSDVVAHSSAIDTLDASKVSLLNVRHIEEIFTVVKFMLAEVPRYDEFAWRWESYSTIHGIRNRLLNIKTPIDPIMQNWIDKNLDHLKRFVEKKFTNDAQACIKYWERYGNWLYPISLKDIFDGTKRKESYVSAEYDWNSHVVHMSPLADQYYGITLKHHSYAEFAVDSVARYQRAFCRECLAVVSKRDDLRFLHAKNIYLDIFRMLDDKPQWYVEMANRKGGRFDLLTNFLLSTGQTLEDAIVVVLGKEPKDPLVFEFNA